MNELIEKCEQELTAARESGDRQAEGKALRNLAFVCHALGRLEEAIDYAQQALVIARETGDRRSEGEVLNNLGIMYSEEGQNEKAIRHLEQALSIYEEMKVWFVGPVRLKLEDLGAREGAERAPIPTPSGPELTADEIKGLVRAQIGDAWESTNAHGVDLREALMPPRRMSVISLGARADKSDARPVDVWLLLIENPESQSGYRIVATLNGSLYGLAYEGADERLVVIGWHRRFLSAFYGM